MTEDATKTNVDFVSVSIKSDSGLTALRNEFFKFLNSEISSNHHNKMRQYITHNLDIVEKLNHTSLQRTTNRLPFSGAFSTSINKKRIKYSGITNFVAEKYGDFLKTEVRITHEIDNYRNSEDFDKDEISYQNLLFHQSALQLAYILGRHLQNGELAKESKLGRKKSKSIISMIDRNYFQLLIAIESFHLDSIASALRNVVSDYIQKVESVSSMLDSILERTDSANQVLKELNLISSSGRELQQALGGFDSSEFSAHSPILGKLVKFIDSLYSSAAGKMVSVDLNRNNDLITPLNLRISTEQNRSTKESILKQVIISIVNQCFVLERGVEDQEVHGVVSIKTVNVVELKDIFKTILAHHEPIYSSLRKRLTHLEDSKLIDPESLEFNERKRTLSDILAWFKNPTNDQDSFKMLILNTPSDFELYYLQITVAENSDAVYENQINDWTRRIAYNPNSDENSHAKLNILNLVKDLDEAIDIDTTAVHEKLVFSIDRMRSADDTYHQEHTALDMTKTTPAGISAKNDLQKLRDKREELSKAYVIEFNRLKKDGLNPNSLEIFAKNIEKKINSYATKLTQTRASDLLSPTDGSPKTLMIGLGQAGQQITHAAVAKLLNTQSDSRSVNLLRGLNIDTTKFKLDDLSENKVEVYEDNKALFKAFDDANILAINAGDEIERLLDTPYNFIWGSRDNKIVRNQVDINFERPAANLVLLDKDGKGSANRMGKGRAYAVRAQRGLQEAIEFKKGAQNITQVCIVHSFAGGSGSGMILPFLSIIKRQLPNAMIWIFSAGAEYESSDPYKTQNTTYITSDILQAHYHAVHHTPEQISSTQWNDFKMDIIKGKLRRLNSSWNDIKEHFNLKQPKPISYTEEMKAKWEKFGFKLDLEYQEHYERVDESVPKDTSQSKLFADAASDPKEMAGIKEFWEEWIAFAQDEGSKSLETILKGNDSSSKENSGELRAGYKLTYSNVMSIAVGIDLLHKNDGEANRVLSLLKYEKNNDQIDFISLGANTSQKKTELLELKEQVEAFAGEMRSYHSHIESLSAKVQMMVGAREDTRIKHVMLSNSHLDRAATFYEGSESSYEIYNSVMVDVYVNLIHSLVSETDFTNSEELQEAASSFEFMDVSDLRAVTAPPIHATLVDLTNTFETNHIHGYNNQIHLRLLQEDPVYDIFKLFFSRGESPLFNSEAKGAQKSGEEFSIQSLYMNYLESDSGIRIFDPVDVIDNLKDEPAYLETRFNSDDIQDLLEFIMKNHKDTWGRCEARGFTEVELLNVANWLALLPIDLLKMCYAESAKEEFDNISTNLKEIQDKRRSEDPNSMFNESNRRNLLANHIGHLLPGANSDCKNEMLELLMKFKILSPDHLAAIPSAMFYEFAPNILVNIIQDFSVKFNRPGKKSNNLELNKLFEIGLIEKNAPPSRHLAMKSVNHPIRKNTDRHDSLRNKNLFDTTELNYLRIPALNDGTGDKGAEVPYFEVNSRFMQHFSQLKVGTGEIYPEFNSITLFDRLVNSSSNNKLGSTREASEIPRFRNATSDLRLYSNPRKLYGEETPVSRIIRLMLFGYRDQNNSRSEAIYTRILKLCSDGDESKLPELLGDFEKIEFQEEFTINNFVNSLNKRITQLIESGENIGKGLNSTSRVLLNNFVSQLDHYTSIYSDEDNGIDNTKLNEFIRNKLFRSLANHYMKDTEVRAKELFDETDHAMDLTGLIVQMKAIGRFFSRLTDVWYQAKRQFNFLQGQMEAGEGVAFELEGTVDAVRSKPEKFLALINNSYPVNPMKAKNSIFHFYEAYLDGGLESGSTTSGKVFLQRLNSGPVANITLLQEKAAIVEIAHRFKGLINKLKKNKFTPITETLVHPYAFLRNMLWMSTMTPKWLKRGTEEYISQFQIDESVVESIFSNPEIIEKLIEIVRTDDLMSGFPFSNEDIVLYEQLKLCAEDVDRTSEIFRKRLRAQIQIPDLLLIKAWQMELDEPTVLDSLLQNEDDKFSEILKIYPKSKWQAKLDDMALTTLEFPPISAGTGDSGGAWDDIFDDEDEDDEDENGSKNYWLAALEKWVKFAENKADKPNEEENVSDTD